ncbi:MAG: hypothetical protein ACTHWZ_08380 [Peptoniphilaceae bacterium]
MVEEYIELYNIKRIKLKLDNLLLIEFRFLNFQENPFIRFQIYEIRSNFHLFFIVKIIFFK